MTVMIELTPEQEERLKSAAAPLGLSPQELAEAAVKDLISKPASDFDDAARQVLAKNKELYDRLA